MTNSFPSGETRRFDPLDIGRIVISEGRKICGLAFEVAYKKGVSHRISELMKNLGVTILYIQVSMPKLGAKTAKVMAFIDLTDSKISPEQIEEALRKREFVKFVRVMSPTLDGFVSDAHYFPLVIRDERVVLFRKEIYAGIFKDMRRKFGSAGEAFLYYEGFETGRRAYDSYVRLAGTSSLEALVEVARAVNMTLGWGVIGDVQVNEKKKTARVRLYENFECELGEGCGKAYSQFYRGGIAGIFTRIFMEEVKVEETKCIAKGDPYCEFVVSKANP